MHSNKRTTVSGEKYRTPRNIRPTKGTNNEFMCFRLVIYITLFYWLLYMVWSIGHVNYGWPLLAVVHTQTCSKFNGAKCLGHWQQCEFLLRFISLAVFSIYWTKLWLLLIHKELIDNINTSYLGTYIRIGSWWMLKMFISHDDMNYTINT